MFYLRLLIGQFRCDNTVTCNLLTRVHGVCNNCSFLVLCNSYTMGCLPVCGDNPRALASGLSYVQVDKHGITILYHLHQCRPCTSSDIHAKVGKGGINIEKRYIPSIER